MAASSSSSSLLTRPLHKPSSVSWKLPVSTSFSVNLRRRSQSPMPRFVVFAMDAKPTVLVAEKLGEAGLSLLKEFANVDCSYNLTPEELCTKISLCDALIVRSGTKVSREVFESSGGRLRVVGRAGVGIDNVDLAAATEHGCLVVNAPTANTVAAAEHGISLLTSMARNVAQADASVKAGKWQRNKYVGVSLVGKTLAVMGFGKVGTEVARRAKGLGMHVIAHDPYAPADRARAIGVDLVSFDEALGSADFLSLHMPLTATTSKILNDETFAKMKKGIRIVNVARGGVIDEDALVRALDAGIVAQAALDVFTVEPPSPDSKLIQHERVTVTPHLGASTMEAQEGVAIEVAEAVVGALKGELAATAVNAPMVPAEVETLLDQVKWDEKGLAVAIAQNIDTGAILMQGFANREALATTISSRKATFFSRSRSTLWTKGETSMNYINIHDIFLDCDRDSIIYLGKPDGPTCHTGSETCYYSSVFDFIENPQAEDDKLALTTLYSLETTISRRKAEITSPTNGKPSWTKRLLVDQDLICSKIREEADELCRTLEDNEDKSRTASEMADVLYHAMVLLARKEVQMEDVLQILRERFSRSGIEEKKSRKQPS